MATRETTTSQANWLHYHQNNVPRQPPGGGGGTGATYGSASPLPESTVFTTTMTAASPATAGGSNPPASEGRVGKAARRRQRASRKTPTTFVDTDTTNFQATVQQYTGAPSEPFQGDRCLATAAAPPTTLSFGLSQLQHRQVAGFPDDSEQQRFLEYQQRHNRPLFTLGGGGDAFLHGYGFGGGDPPRAKMEVSDGYLQEDVSAASSSHNLHATGCIGTSDEFFF